MLPSLLFPAFRNIMFNEHGRASSQTLQQYFPTIRALGTTWLLLVASLHSASVAQSCDPALAHTAATARHLTTRVHAPPRPAPRRRRARSVISVFEKRLNPAAVSSILLSEPVAASCAFSVVVWQALSPSALTLASAVRRRRKRARCQVLFFCGYRAPGDVSSLLVGRRESPARPPP